MQIILDENEKDKYLLWAKNKSWHHNSPVFWGKNDSGYYSNIENCQLYTKEEAYRRANCPEKDNIPVKLSDLVDCMRVTFLNVYEPLDKAMKEFKDETNG